jgi:hypothetical protein
VYANVSEVGLNANLSPISFVPECVTQKTSGLNPAKCFCSFPNSDSGINIGKNPFLTPLRANFLSNVLLSDSQIEYPSGLSTINPLTGA